MGSLSTSVPLATRRTPSADAWKCLAYRSSRLRRLAQSTAPRLVGCVLALLHERLIASAIAERVRLPRSTVGAILRWHGLGCLTALQPAVPVSRQERAPPGDLLHLDTKTLARIGLPDNGSGYRSTVPMPCSVPSASRTCTPGGRRRAPTARPSAWCRRCSASGPTTGPTPTHESAPPPIARCPSHEQRVQPSQLVRGARQSPYWMTKDMRFV